MNTWNSDGVGGGGGVDTSTLLLKNGILTNCLLFGNTKVCCYTNWLQLNAFSVSESCG